MHKYCDLSIKVVKCKGWNINLLKECHSLMSIGAKKLPGLSELSSWTVIMYINQTVIHVLLYDTKLGLQDDLFMKITTASSFKCVTWWEIVHYLLQCGMADREQENVTAEFLHVQVCISKKSHPQTLVMKPKNILYSILFSQCCC